ncbi:rCG54576 [Rattus norvegicus]|uniref:RCG54576 n=1 Tax=Rattus norvegicus TaxID=10116 RepID=A6JBH3_RAT|nr:rCG54576 [Rattus norvegicus]
MESYVGSYNSLLDSPSQKDREVLPCLIWKSLRLWVWCCA